MATQLGGAVASAESLGKAREFGYSEVRAHGHTNLLKGIQDFSTSEGHGILKVWMSHGTRGDFVDYRGKQRYAHSGNWCFTVYESGALPYFEKPEQFSADLLQFISPT